MTPGYRFPEPVAYVVRRAVINVRGITVFERELQLPDDEFRHNGYKFVRVVVHGHETHLKAVSHVGALVLLDKDIETLRHSHDFLHTLTRWNPSSQNAKVKCLIQRPLMD